MSMWSDSVIFSLVDRLTEAAPLEHQCQAAKFVAYKATVSPDTKSNLFACQIRLWSRRLVASTS